MADMFQQLGMLGIGDVKSEEKTKKYINDKVEISSAKENIKTKELKDSTEDFQGEISVKAFGTEQFRIQCPVKLEIIRQKLVEECGFDEFTKDRTVFRFIKDKSILDSSVTFHAKG